MVSLRVILMVSLGVVACVLAAAFTLIATSETIVGVAFSVFYYAPTFFAGLLPGDSTNKKWIKMGLLISCFNCALVAAYSLQFMNIAGFLTDSAMAWLEMVRTTWQLYLLPFYFACIRNRSSEGRQRASIGPKTVILPGGVVVGIAFVPRTLMDTVVRSNECRAVAYYYSSFIVHCACTLAPVAAVAWFGLVTVETILPYFAGCSVLAMTLCAPLFFFKTLNTPIYSFRVSWSLVPALAATFLLQAYGGVDLKEIHRSRFL